MSKSILDILLRPDAFFRDATGEEESLKIPALIILIGAIIGSATAYFMAGPTAQMMDGITPGLGSITLVMALVMSFIGVFFSLIFLAEIFFIISMALRNELVPGFNREFIASVLGVAGLLVVIVTSLLEKNVSATPDTVTLIISLLPVVGILAIIVSIFIFLSNERFQRPLEFIGYGYIPQVAGSLITLVAVYTYVPRITVPVLTKTVLENPSALQAAMKTLMHDPAMVELTQITTLITIVFLLWSANIWIFGMKHSRQLSPRDAALCVGIPVVAYVLFMIYNLGAL
jgi:hypothetical protein